MDLERVAEIQKDLRQFKEFGAVKITKLLKYLKQTGLTKEQIQVTKISKTVTSISKVEVEESNQDQTEMVEEAKNLIQDWKKLFSGASSAGAAANKEQKKQQQVKQVQKLSFDQVDTSVLENNFRQPIRFKALKGIYQFLMTAAGSKTSEQIETMARSIEKGIWKKNDKVDDNALVERNYGQDINKLCNNLKKKEKLKFEIVKGVHSIESVGNMDARVFYTEAQKAEIKRLQEEIEAQNDPDFFKKKKQQFQKNAADGEECEKCKGLKAYCVNEVQIRGADEPMTRFMRCDECDHNWQD